MKLKIWLSTVAGIALAAHILAPALKLDGVSLGLIVIGLLPWFQPLLKSVEFPGGLKVELQDVKSATDKLTGPDVHVAEAALTKPAGLSDLQDVAILAADDPNLVLVALRIELEKRLIDLARSAGVSTERRSIAVIVQELVRREAIPAAVANGVTELIALGNQAAHGASVTKQAADWAVDLAPQILGTLSTLRRGATVTIEGEIPRAEVLGAFKRQTAIRQEFRRPFMATPEITIAFEWSGSSLSSGSVRKASADERGFECEVVELPASHEVSLWTLKWRATGRV